MTYRIAPEYLFSLALRLGDAGLFLSWPERSDMAKLVSSTGSTVRLFRDGNVSVGGRDTMMLCSLIETYIESVGVEAAGTAA